MKIGDFVTGKLLHEDEIRQGIVLAQDNSAVVIKGQSGKLYFVEPNSTIVVPDNTLWGDTKEFVVAQRKRMGM